MLQTVKGIYKNGKIELNEIPTSILEGQILIRCNIFHHANKVSRLLPLRLCLFASLREIKLNVVHLPKNGCKIFTY